MKEILKTLSKYKWSILLVIGLLIGQAYCDLALPTYTSNIVNVGIQQGGIENITPKAMREETYNGIKYYLAGEELEKFTSSYKLILKGNENYIKDYSALNNENIYLYVGKEELDDIIMMPLMSNLSKETEGMNLGFLGGDITKNEALIKSGLISVIRSEYVSLGMDLEKVQMDYIYKVGSKMILVALLAFTLTAISVYLSSKISAGFARDLREKMVSKVLDFEPQDLAKFSQASLITRCTNDIVQVQGLIMAFLRIIIFAPIMAVGAITKVSGSSLSWIIIVSVIAIFILMLVLFFVVVPKFKLFQDLLDKLNLVSRENLNGLGVIRAFANEKEEEKRFDEANRALTKNGLFVNKAMSIMMPTLTFLMNSVAIIIIWFGANEVNTFNMQVGDLIAFITYTMQIIMSFLMISMVAIMLPRAIVSIKRINEIFKTEKKVKDKEKTKKFTGDCSVEFKDVYFRYPDANEDVLRNINFKAEKGTTTAFIGSTGSGKSTLINLIPRFYDVTGGKILINGEDIRDVKLEDLRDLIGYVPQKGKLFKGTVMSNLEFGQKKKDEEQAKEAARIAQAEEFILEEEKAYDREISEGGTNVSGGQRQRLSIARALAKPSEILIFDDSFSALDFKTDAALRKELAKHTKDKIVFIVAQRVSSIMHADNIIVLNEGEIVGMGTHEELLKTCDVYREIKISQLGEED